MPEHELQLLALDGGSGIEGLSSLQILKKLMDTVGPGSSPKPCDYFDMIGGTGTGGLIAIMLGRLQMTVDNCIDAYVSLSNRVFHKPRHCIAIKGNNQAKVKSEELERAIKEMVVKQGLEEGALFEDIDAKCKVFVCTTSMETGETVWLTSYCSPRSGYLSSTVKIWEAARATSLAPTFFDPITIGCLQERFISGSIGANDPVYKLWHETQDIWPLGSLEDKVKCLISIGTGVPSPESCNDDLAGYHKFVLGIVTQTEKTAETFYRDKAGLCNKGCYYRFKVPNELKNIGLEELEQKGAIIAATDRYIESQDVSKQMKACASNLAKKPCTSDLFGLTHIWIGQLASLCIGCGL